MFIVGSIIGSFMNVLIYRIPKNIGFIKGRSYCPSCHHMIAWYDLIPFVSYLFLKGKCRHCHQKISISYPIIELLAGVLLVGITYCYPRRLEALLLYLLIATLVVMSKIDMDTNQVYHCLLLWLCMIGIVYQFIYGTSFKECLQSMLCVSLFLWIVTKIVPDSFGMGDIYLYGIIGLFLSWQDCVLSFYIAVLTGSVYGLLKMGQEKQIPFVPFISLGVLVCLFLV
ncbi:prepilin peptidase [Tannockella kyphosi]|uniref:prepilin peptidase n=1 Tax=Tannockella kyphosi TaxID=2899121 RepID=UPI002010EAD4|nr:A24 family peptidase [Tannockella kyphosi]